jgi:hypothetical protein
MFGANYFALPYFGMGPSQVQELIRASTDLIGTFDTQTELIGTFDVQTELIGTDVRTTALRGTVDGQ